MSNGISYKFSFETDDYKSANELTQYVLGRISTLDTTKTQYRSIEFSLSKPGANQKTASLTIHTHDSVIREESEEQDLREAINKVFNQAEMTNEKSIKLD